jgi:2-polyprenyl-3-methyl-5-hydroxy-6-metoxy-1,4-benzoquinol methylase
VSDHPPWDESYRGTPPWDIGRPQPAIAALPLAGEVIDVGCGTGEHTLLAASRGASALGIDVAATAIERARAKARERGLAARFEVRDAFELSSLDERFDMAIDSGLYHVFDDVETRRRHAAGLSHVVKPGGMLYLMCFSERTPGDWGPNRIRREELEETFASWTVDRLERAAFDLNPGLPVEQADAWLLVARR